MVTIGKCRQLLRLVRSSHRDIVREFLRDPNTMAQLGAKPGPTVLLELWRLLRGEAATMMLGALSDLLVFTLRRSIDLSVRSQERVHLLNIALVTFSNSVRIPELQQLCAHQPELRSTIQSVALNPFVSDSSSSFVVGHPTLWKLLIKTLESGALPLADVSIGSMLRLIHYITDNTEHHGVLDLVVWWAHRQRHHNAMQPVLEVVRACWQQAHGAQPSILGLFPTDVHGDQPPPLLTTEHTQRIPIACSPNHQYIHVAVLNVYFVSSLSVRSFFFCYVCYLLRIHSCFFFEL